MSKLFATSFPLIAMIHLDPLPGSPLFSSMEAVVANALADADAAAEGGASALMIENFNDRPFAKTAPVETIAAMSRAASEIARAVDVPFGINVLRNDGLAALAIAAATGAAFVRINVLTGAMLTDQGIIEGEAHRILRRRRELGLGNCLILADHLVKHAVPLASFDFEQSAKDLRYRGMADAIVVSGAETGAPADPGRFERLRAVVDAPLLVGSGLNESNAATYRAIANGAIVGTSIKSNGRVDAEKLRRLKEVIGV
jgi:uncharacterized protein